MLSIFKKSNVKVDRKYRKTYKLWLKIKAELEAVDRELCSSIFMPNCCWGDIGEIPYPIIRIDSIVLVLRSNYIEMWFHNVEKSVELHRGKIITSNDINPYVCEMYIDEALTELIHDCHEEDIDITKKCDKIAEILKKYFCERRGDNT